MVPVHFLALSLLVVTFGGCTAVPPMQPADAGEQRRMQVTVAYEAPTSRDLADIAEKLRAAGIVERWSEVAATRFRWLHLAIDAVLMECGNGQSRYESEQRRVILCYEDEALRSALLGQAADAAARDGAAWTGSVLHELYHELAHALIDALALPVVGSEEQAADQFGFIHLLEHELGGELALGAAAYLGNLAEIEMQGGVLDPADPHPFLAQRYYNALCVIYGSDPDRFRLLVDEGRLPRRRAAVCRAEYLQAARAWQALLSVRK